MRQNLFFEKHHQAIKDLSDGRRFVASRVWVLDRIEFAIYFEGVAVLQKTVAEGRSAGTELKKKTEFFVQIIAPKSLRVAWVGDVVVTAGGWDNVELGLDDGESDFVGKVIGTLAKNKSI